MEVVKHDGKEYIKLVELAKEFSYTTDYLGQLCRSKKVDAKLIGRAWYVTRESLELHRSQKYQSKRVGLQAQEENKRGQYDKVFIEPSIHHKTFKIVSNFNTNDQPRAVYEADSGSLFPDLKKPPLELKEEAEINEELGSNDSKDSETVNISINKIKEAPLAEEEARASVVKNDNTKIKIVALNHSTKAPISVLRPARPQTKSFQNQSGLSQPDEQENLVKSSHIGKSLTSHEVKSEALPLSFAPASVQAKAGKNRAKSQNKQKIQATTLKSAFFPIISVGAAMIVAFVLLGLQYQTLILEGEPRSAFSFQTANVVEAIEETRALSFTFLEQF